MKHRVMLTITSLLSIIFTSFHHADDVVRGMAPGGFSNLIPVLFLFVWLYGTLALAERRSGYIIIFVLSLLAAGLPIIHMRRSGLVGGIAKPSGDFGEFFFVWTLLALGVTALCSVILSVRGLWSLRRGQPQQSNNPNTERPHGVGDRGGSGSAGPLMETKGTTESWATAAK